MNAAEFAEQVYAILNIGGAVKLPNSTKAVLAERFEAFAAEQRAEELAKSNLHNILTEQEINWNVREQLAAAEAERDQLKKQEDLYALLRGVCEDAIDWIGSLSYDHGTMTAKNVLDHKLTQDMRDKLHKMYQHPLDNKLLRRTDQLESIEAERDRAVRALRSLRNEVSGALGMGETGIMAAVGYTNLVVLKTKLAEADEVLSVSPVPVPADKTTTSPAEGRNLACSTDESRSEDGVMATQIGTGKPIAAQIVGGESVPVPAPTKENQ